MLVIQKDGVFFLDKEDGERIRIGNFLSARDLQSALGRSIDVYIFETMKELSPEDDDDDDEDDFDDEEIEEIEEVEEIEEDEDDIDDEDFFEDDDDDN